MSSSQSIVLQGLNLSAGVISSAGTLTLEKTPAFYVENAMYEIRELLYCSIFRPIEFSHWASVYITSDERNILANFSKKFLKIIAPHSDILDEAEIVKMRRDIFSSCKKICEERRVLSGALEDVNSFKPDHVYLQGILKQLNIELNGWFKSWGVDLDQAKRSPEIYITNINECIRKMLAYLDYYPTEYLELKKSLTSIRLTLKSLHQKQGQVEDLASDLQILNMYKTAIAQLMSENKSDKLKDLLSRMPDWTEFLQSNIYGLFQIADKFKAYIKNNPFMLPREAASEENHVGALREAARKSRREKLEKEIEEIALRNLSIFNTYQRGQELYEMDGKLEALEKFVSGAKSFHYVSLLKAGEMIMNGEACHANPELACLYLQAAAVKAGNEEQKMKALKVLIDTCQKKEVGRDRHQAISASTGDAIDALADKGDELVGSFRADFEMLEKHIRLAGDPAQQLLALGESYLARYLLSLDSSKREDDKVNPHLVTACKYFEDAYKLSKGRCDGYRIRYIALTGRNPDEITEEAEKSYSMTLFPEYWDSQQEQDKAKYQARDLLKGYLAAKQELNGIIDSISDKMNYALEEEDSNDKNIFHIMEFVWKINPSTGFTAELGMRSS